MSSVEIREGEKWKYKFGGILYVTGLSVLQYTWPRKDPEKYYKNKFVYWLLSFYPT